MKPFFAFIAVLISFNAFGQEIKYQKSYTEALTLADKTNKPLFVTLMPPIPNNKVLPQFKSALDTKEITDIYNKNFIAYKPWLLTRL